MYMKTFFQMMTCQCDWLWKTVLCKLILRTAHGGKAPPTSLGLPQSSTESQGNQTHATSAEGCFDASLYQEDTQGNKWIMRKSTNLPKHPCCKACYSINEDQYAREA